MLWMTPGYLCALRKGARTHVMRKSNALGKKYTRLGRCSMYYVFKYNLPHRVYITYLSGSVFYVDNTICKLDENV